MKSQIRLSTEIQQFLCCPSCKMVLELISDEYRGTNFECGKFFPIINGILILINESNSVFSIDDFINHRNTFFDLPQRSNIKETIKQILPDIGRNIKSKQNYKKFAQHLLFKSSTPKVLVFGGSILDKGIDNGAVCCPGMALAWSYNYFLLSFTKSKMLRNFIAVFVRLTSFYLKYFDYYLINKPGTLDAASGYYFMGQKSNKILTDRELIKLYRGAI